MNRSLIPSFFAARGVAPAIACVAPLLLAACSSDRNTDWTFIYNAAVESFGAGNTSVRLERAAAIPYATIGIRIGGGPEQILILATREGGSDLWVSSRKLALMIRDGRVLRSAGLGADLSGTVMTSGTGALWHTQSEVTWNADFEDLGVYSATISCRLTQLGADPIVILGTTIETNRVEEACRSNQLNWSYTNTYWVSAETGVVWRSVQTVHPMAEPLEIQILRPPE